MHHLLAIALLATAPAAPPPAPAAVSATPALDEARELGWDAAQRIVDRMTQAPDAWPPGITAFLADFRRVAGERQASLGAGRRHAVDVDALVTRNPAFWRASYEVAPADPAWLILHASLLLAAGEASRAQQIAALAHLPGKPVAPWGGLLAGIVSTSQRVIDEGDVLVDQGIEAFDAGRRAEALKAYERALAAWPQNGRAHYETGLCHLMDAVEKPAIKKGRKHQKRASEEVVAAGQSAFHRDGAAAAFALSRHHDPLQWMAYQGTGDRVLQLQAMLGRVEPAWGKLRESSFTKLDDAELLEMTLGLQEAEVDELALVSRQILVLRRGRFAQEDHPFITTSLRRLAPGEATDAALAMLAGERLSLVTLARP